MEPINILLIGGSGQVGRAWIDLAQEKLFRLQTLARHEVDLSTPESVQESLNAQVKATPQAVVLAAAYTQVDLAEKEADVSRRVNALSVHEISSWCAARAIPLLHYSTDYVYSGAGTSARTESEPTHPLNVYGETKLEGENYIRASRCRHLIFRTSWVYDAEGKNFFKTMLKLGETHPSLRIVGDQIGAPTYAPHLAKASYEALMHCLKVENPPWGTYHLCSPGETSWYFFAKEIFHRMHACTGASSGYASLSKIPTLTAIATADYPTPAKRPLNSRIDLTRARLLLGVDFDRDLPHWTLGLDACVHHYLRSSR